MNEEVAMERPVERGSRRTCVGCRGVAAKDGLLRLAIVPDPRAPGQNTVVADVRSRLGGRGVSVHPKRACLARAIAQGLPRELRAPVQLSVGVLAEQARTQYLGRIAGLVMGAWRARLLVIGTDSVEAALRERSEMLELLVVASDAGRREDIEAGAARLGRAAVVYGDKAALGALVGRDEVAVFGVLDRGIAEELGRALAGAASLSEDV